MLRAATANTAAEPPLPTHVKTPEARRSNVRTRSNGCPPRSAGGPRPGGARRHLCCGGAARRPLRHSGASSPSAPFPVQNSHLPFPKIDGPAGVEKRFAGTQLELAQASGTSGPAKAIELQALNVKDKVDIGQTPGCCCSQSLLRTHVAPLMIPEFSPAVFGATSWISKYSAINPFSGTESNATSVRLEVEQIQLVRR